MKWQVTYVCAFNKWEGEQEISSLQSINFPEGAGKARNVLWRLMNEIAYLQNINSPIVKWVERWETSLTWSGLSDFATLPNEFLAESDAVFPFVLTWITVLPFQRKLCGKQSVETVWKLWFLIIYQTCEFLKGVSSPRSSVEHKKQ